MNGSTDIVVIISSFAAVVAGFLAVAKIMLTTATKDREADRRERLELSKAIERMATSSAQVAKATDKSAREAKERNGHQSEHTVALGELVAQGNRLTERMLKRLDASAKIAEEAANDGGILVKTKPGKPITVVNKENKPLDVKVKE